MINFDNVIILLISAAAALLSITVHEFSHGFAAYRLGDDTAKVYGRLTLNPLKHIDWFGALCLVVFHFGWAKPVPVNSYNFKKPRRDTAIVSLAGPVSNFLLAFVSVFLAIALPYNEYLNLFLVQMAHLNLGLGVFNLIPIPPLDGSKIVASFLKGGTAYRYLSIERYGSLILIALLWLGILNPVLNFGVRGILQFFIKIITFLLGA